MDEREQDAERFESIPWSSLLPEENQRRNRLLTAVGVVALVVVGGAVGLRFVGSPSATVVSLAPMSESAPTAPPASPPEVPADPTPEGPAASATMSTIATGPGDPVYSEADLMATMPDVSTRAAVMRAEWFVTDYFTVDADASAAQVRQSLVPVDGVSLPHDAPAGVSYVEWARAFAVDQVAPSSYRVAVAFRTLAAPAGQPVVRRPVRAVEVEVMVMSGSSTVTDLPRPIPPPGAESRDQDRVIRVAGEHRAPPAAAAEAVAAAHTVGADASVIGAEPRDGGWHFLVEVTDHSGMAFPLSVWLPGP